MARLIAYNNLGEGIKLTNGNVTNDRFVNLDAFTRNTREYISDNIFKAITDYPSDHLRVIRMIEQTSNDFILQKISFFNLSNNAKIAEAKDISIHFTDYKNIDFSQLTADSDRINGNRFNDFLDGARGNDSIFGNDGNDSIKGGHGRDRLYGGLGDDLLTGGFQADLLNGNQGADRLDGGFGNDQLFAGTGADRLTGAKGADDLNLGNDTQTDRIIFNSIHDSRAASGIDHVALFDTGEDKVQLNGIDANIKTKGNQTFVFSKNGAENHAVWIVKQNSDIRLLADVNGDKKSDFQIIFDDLGSLQQSDMIL